MCLSVLDRQLHALLNVTIRVDQLNIQDLAYTGQAVVVSPCNIGLEPYLLILEISSVVKVQVDLLLREHLVELVDGIRKRCYAVVGCQAHERVGKHKKKKYKRLLHILPLFRVHKCFYLKRTLSKVLCRKDRHILDGQKEISLKDNSEIPNCSE